MKPEKLAEFIEVAKALAETPFALHPTHYGSPKRLAFDAALAALEGEADAE